MTRKLITLGGRLLVVAWVLWAVAVAVLWVVARSTPAPPSPGAKGAPIAPTTPIASVGKAIPLTSETPAQAKQPPLDAVTQARIITGDFAIYARPGKPFRVAVFLDRGASNDDQKLAQDVKAALERLEPENPGRERTFGRNHLALPSGTNPVTTPLKRRGWTLIITAVERRHDGWEATVRVCLRVGDSDASNISVIANHIEIYASRHGKITLENEIADDNWKPGDGLPWAMF